MITKDKVDAFYNKMADIQSHLDSITDEEFEEFVDIIFSVGKNEDPSKGIKHRYEAVAFARGLIAELKENNDD